MKTVQVALNNPEYAEALQGLLLRDGSHRVYVVEQPDLRLDGVIVVDGSQAEMVAGEAERFVVITRKGSDHLNRIWDAGVRHVVFEGDSPSTAYLAIVAAELRLPRIHAVGASDSVPSLGIVRSGLRGNFPIVDLPAHRPGCHFCKPCNLF